MTPRVPNLRSRWDRAAVAWNAVVALLLLSRVQVIQVAVEFVEAVNRRQVLISVTEMALAEMAAAVAGLPHHLGRMEGLTFRPSSSPGDPTVVMPERIGYWPVMKAARPAVQEGCA